MKGNLSMANSQLFEKEHQSEKQEIWGYIPSCEEQYQSSNLGRIKSLKHNKEIILKTSIDSTGYYCVNINRTPRRVHQLVAMTFLNHTPCGYKLVVDHIDDDPLNNNVNNLQVITHSKNIRKGLKSKGSSKYIGVHWSKSANKWVAQTQVNGKTKHLGCFNNEVDAHNSYQNYIKND